MNFLIFNTLICICICFVGCNLQSNNLSTGVSLEGTGKPTLEETPNLTTPPILTDEKYNILENEFTLWSAGEKKKFCSNLSMAMQLIHPISWEPLSLQQGYPIIYGEATSKRLAGMMVNITNHSTKDMTNILENCQPSLKVVDNAGNLIPLEMNFTCSNSYSTVKHPSGETIQYKFIFALPDRTALNHLIYIHKYNELSLEIDNSKEFTCDLQYPLHLIK